MFFFPTLLKVVYLSKVEENVSGSCVRNIVRGLFS